jgi:hypothetical protein
MILIIYSGINVIKTLKAVIFFLKGVTPFFSFKQSEQNFSKTFFVDTRESFSEIKSYIFFVIFCGVPPMDATSFIINDRSSNSEPIYIVGFSEHGVSGENGFKIIFSGKDITQQVLDAIEFKKKLKNGEYVIRGKKPRKKKSRINEGTEPTEEPEGDEEVVYNRRPEIIERIIQNSSSNISAMDGSDVEESSDIFETVSLQRKEEPAQITSIISEDTSHGIYDQDDDEECPITLKRKKPSKSVISDANESDEELPSMETPAPDNNAPKVSQKKVKEAQWSQILSSGMKAEELRRYVICGGIASEIISPLFTFILKIAKNTWKCRDGTETYQLISVIHSQVVPRIPISLLKKKAQMSTYFGQYVPNVLKTKKKMNFTEDDLLNEDKAKKMSELACSQSTNSKVNLLIKKALSDFIHTVGQDAVVTRENIRYITDQRILLLLKNVFEDKIYFKTISVFGKSAITSKVVREELESLGLMKKDVSIPFFCYTNIMQSLQNMIWKTHLTREMVEYVFKKCLKKQINDVPPQSQIDSDINFILEISDIYFSLNKEGNDFGSTSYREKLNKKWSRDAIDFFRSEHAKVNNEGRVYLSELNIANGILHCITPLTVANTEIQNAMLLSRLEDCSAFTTYCDDGVSPIDPYFEEMRNVITKNQNRVVVYTCCKTRKYLLQDELRISNVQILYIDDVRETKKIANTAIIDRAHKMTLDSLYAVLTQKQPNRPENNNSNLNMLFKRVYFFGNCELSPKRGQPFKDICQSGIIPVKHINSDYNLKKIAGNFSTTGALSMYIREQKPRRISVVLQNKEELRNAVDQRNPQSLSRQLGVDVSHFFSITDIDLNGDGHIKDLTIFCITEKTTKFDISKILDVTVADPKKPTVAFYSAQNISFEGTKPAIPKCTSFSSILQSHWEL